MEEINWEQFVQVELRVGEIIEVTDFIEARNPSYKVVVDFGKELGLRKSSAQIVDNYTKESLIGKQVVCVINFPKKQIANFMSECLITGFYNSDNTVVLCIPDKKVPLGRKIG